MEAEIGIIGGSGFYSLLEKVESIEIETEYGRPSDRITLGMIEGRQIAFLPRHGKRHVIPPHRVPYKANIEALSRLGVTRIIATNAVGSLREEYAPGDFVFFDQFVNMTQGRDDTFFHSQPVTHVSPAEPYCSELRKVVSGIANEMKVRHHDDGTVAVVNGPRFSTKAESRFFSRQGFQTINMTQYPEVMLAMERSMCYLGIGIVTDYDVGLEGRGEISAVNAEEVNRVFGRSVNTAKEMISKLIPSIPKERGCSCQSSMHGAVINPLPDPK